MSFTCHTQTIVAWFDNKSNWSAASPYVLTTVHLAFSPGVGTFLHHIMEHTAHHVDMGVPLYRLQAAQASLQAILPESIIVQRFSWTWYFSIARACKLYDFEYRC